MHITHIFSPFRAHTQPYPQTTHRHMRLYSTAAALAVVLLSGEGIQAQKLRTTGGGKDLVGVDVTAQGTNSVQMVPGAGKAAGDAGEKRQYRGKGGMEGCTPCGNVINKARFDSSSHATSPQFPYKCTGVNLGGWLVSTQKGRKGGRAVSDMTWGPGSPPLSLCSPSHSPRPPFPPASSSGDGVVDVSRLLQDLGH